MSGRALQHKLIIYGDPWWTTTVQPYVGESDGAAMWRRDKAIADRLRAIDPLAALRAICPVCDRARELYDRDPLTCLKRKVGDV